MRSRAPTHSAPTSNDGRQWLPLGLGVAGLLAIPVLGRVLRMLMQGQGVVGVSPSQVAVVVAIVLGLAGLVTGVRALRRHGGSGLLWAGTVVSGLVVLLLGGFALGEVLFPH